MAEITGVRFERAGRVYYCAAAEALAVGDRVVVETPGGARWGWVVIAPEQVLVAALAEPPSMVARRAERPPEAAAGDDADAAVGHFGLADAVVGQFGLADAAVGHFGLAAALIGSAQAPPLPPELGASAGLVARLAAGLSPRNRDYVARKLSLPALGQRVETARGPGRVVAVKVPREHATVALDAGGEIVLGGPALQPVPADELDPPRGERRGRRGRRRERPAAGEEGPGATDR